jgi:hypothetical protein
MKVSISQVTEILEDGERKVTTWILVNDVCVLVSDQNYNKGMETHYSHKESHGGGDLYRFRTFRGPIISRRYG